MRHVLFDVAPDRAVELEAALQEHQVRVVVVNRQHESPFAAIPGQGEIRAHMPALKRQLVMALAYVMTYRAAEQDAPPSGRRVHLPDDVRGIAAREMLGWAMLERYRVAQAKERGGVPPDEPVPLHWFPFPNAPRGSDDRIAIGMFYTAMAADLHHELAHLTKGHGTSDLAEAVRQEEDADEEAARWLVGNRTDDDPQFAGRILGLALSQMYEVFLTLEGFTNDPVHPPLVGRLRAALTGRVRDPDHAVWAFVSTALTLHLTLANRRFPFDPDRVHPTFRDMAEYLMSVYEGSSS